MSRGGEYAYIWATTHPDKVSCIYADNPGGNREHLKRLGALAEYAVPLLHVCGSVDPLVGRVFRRPWKLFTSNSADENFRDDQGRFGPPSPWFAGPNADCRLHLPKRSGNHTGVPPSNVVEQIYQGSSFYDDENFYRDFPSRRDIHHLPGARCFTPCYDRYQFNPENRRSWFERDRAKPAAPGNPWVFRSDFVGRGASVDQALLAKGYYIVTGPIPYDVGPVAWHNGTPPIST